MPCCPRTSFINDDTVGYESYFRGASPTNTMCQAIDKAKEIFGDPERNPFSWRDRASIPHQASFDHSGSLVSPFIGRERGENEYHHVVIAWKDKEGKSHEKLISFTRDQHYEFLAFAHQCKSEQICNLNPVGAINSSSTATKALGLFVPFTAKCFVHIKEGDCRALLILFAFILDMILLLTLIRPIAWALSTPDKKEDHPLHQMLKDTYHTDVQANSVSVHFLYTYENRDMETEDYVGCRQRGVKLELTFGYNVDFVRLPYYAGASDWYHKTEYSSLGLSEQEEPDYFVPKPNSGRPNAQQFEPKFESAGFAGSGDDYHEFEDSDAPRAGAGKSHQGAEAPPSAEDIAKKERAQKRKEPLEYFELSETATDADIRQRFKELAKTHHPDRNNGSQDKMKTLNEHYAVLNPAPMQQVS